MSKTPRVKVSCHCGKKLSVKANTTRPFKCIQCGQYLKLPEAPVAAEVVTPIEPGPRIVRSLPPSGQVHPPAMQHPAPLQPVHPAPVHQPPRDLLQPLGPSPVSSQRPAQTAKPRRVRKKTRPSYLAAYDQQGFEAKDIGALFVVGLMLAVFGALAVFEMPDAFGEYNVPDSADFVEKSGVPQNLEGAMIVGVRHSGSSMTFDLNGEGIYIDAAYVPDFEKVKQAIARAEQVALKVLPGRNDYMHVAFWELKVDGQVVVSQAEMEAFHKSSRGSRVAFMTMYSLIFLIGIIITPVYYFRKWFT